MLPSVDKLSSNNRDRQPCHHSFNSNRSRQTETDSQITTILTVTEADRQRFLEQQRQPARSPQERAGAGDPVVPEAGPRQKEAGRGGGGGGVARRRWPGWSQASGERSICRRTDGALEDAGESDVTCGPPSD